MLEGYAHTLQTSCNVSKISYHIQRFDYSESLSVVVLLSYFHCNSTSNHYRPVHPQSSLGWKGIIGIFSHLMANRFWYVMDTKNRYRILLRNFRKTWFFMIRNMIVVEFTNYSKINFSSVFTINLTQDTSTSFIFAVEINFWRDQFSRGFIFADEKFAVVCLDLFLKILKLK